MSNRNIPYISLESITLHVAGNEETKKRSSATINRFDFTQTGTIESKGALNDRKMGSTSDRVRCETCKHTKEKCPGHSGMLLLNYPVLSPYFVKVAVIWLKIICVKCGGLVNGPPKPGKHNIFKKYAEKITANNIKKGLYCKSELSKGVQCGQKQPLICIDTNDNMRFLLEEYEVDNDKKINKVKTRDIYAREIHRIFKRVSFETLKLLNISFDSHPKNYIITHLHVPPNSIRPDAGSVNSRISNNDTTIHLNNIVKKNQKISASSIEVNEDSIRTEIYDLANAVFDMIVGPSAANVSGGDKTATSIKNKITGKRGRIRGNIHGGRIHNSGRNFIVCDVRLKMNEVGLPYKMTKNFHPPEVVFEQNKAQLMKYVLNGEDKYPGCKFIFKKRLNKKFRRSRMKQEYLNLEVGDIIYRDMVDGDIVHFNRQPTLQRSNITAMVVKVLHSNVIVFNVDICNLFAADFDGDEMTIYDTVNNIISYEVFNLASVYEHFISGATGGPIIGQFQDAVIGSALMTRDEVKINKFHAMMLFRNQDIYPRFDKAEYSGRDIFSTLFQETKTYINYSNKATFYNKEHAEYRQYSGSEVNVKVERGEFLTGCIDKKAIGNKARNGIYHIINNKYGAKKALDIMWHMQQLAIYYMNLKGFTVGIADFIIRKENLDEIYEIESKMIQESINITKTLFKDGIMPPPGKTVLEHYERMQLATLQGSDEYYKSIHDGIDYHNNNLYLDVFHGSKGSPENLLEIAAAGGSKTILGKRLPKSLDGRSNQFYTRDSIDPRSRGLVANSYTTGNTVVEITSNAAEARNGFIGKALGTGISGKQDRYGKMSLESHIVDNQFKLVKCTTVIQSVYGGDGKDTRYTLFVKYKAYDDVEKFHVKGSSSEQTVLDEQYEAIKRDRQELFEAKIAFELRTQKSASDEIMTSVDVSALVNDYWVKYVKNRKNAPALNVVEAAMRVKKLCDMECDLWYLNPFVKEIPDYLKDANTQFKVLLRSELSIYLLKELGINNDDLEIIITRIKDAFVNTIIDPGSAEGLRAAQAISEPMTQVALKSIHGESNEKMVNYQELIRAVERSKMAQAGMQIYLLPEYAVNEEAVTKFANEIEMVKFGKFVNTYQIFYEEFGKPLHPSYKNETVYINEFASANNYDKPPGDLMPWCIRFEIDKFELISKQVSLETMYIELSAKFENCYIVYSSVDNNVLYFRVYMRQVMHKKYKLMESEDVKNLAEDFLKTIIRGIDRIIAASVKSRHESYIDEKGNIARHKYYYVATNGCNMEDVLMHPFVDPSKIVTDSIHDMANIYGICSARNMVIDLLYHIVTTGADYRHFTVYADEMCSKEYITAINRFGSDKRGSSPLQLIGDTSPHKFARKAAVRGMVDRLYGVSAPMLIGKTPDIGTHYNDIIINEDFISRNNSKVEDDLIDL